jgi:wyosine [tRNA(Phe)-imidazoG37] synthetase (radical SAM superfamily)
MSIKFITVFGPINSRRFGRSLGVDLSPNIKQCNFDCLYCEIQKEECEKVEQYIDPLVSSKIVVEIEEALKKFPEINVLTFTANGEPTLYPDLYNLIIKVNKIKPLYKFKTLILSNGGNIFKHQIREILMKFDKVKLSLDCATENCFAKLDRPLKHIKIKDVKSGLLEFSKMYSGELYIETLFVKGINDNPKELLELNNFFLQMHNITRIDFGTIDRPPLYNVKPISHQSLYQISQHFNKYLPIFIVGKAEKNHIKYYLTKSELLHTLGIRPLTQYDFENLFDEKTSENLKSLKKEGLIEQKKVGEVIFYQPIKSLRQTQMEQ